MKLYIFIAIIFTYMLSFANKENAAKIGSLNVIYSAPISQYISPRNDCAELSTYMALKYFDKSVNISDCVNFFQSFPERPFSFLDLLVALDHFCLNAKGVKFSNKEDIFKIKHVAFILHLKTSKNTGTTDHFVFCFKDSHDKLWMADLSLGENVIEFSNKSMAFLLWDGNALIIEE